MNQLFLKHMLEILNDDYEAYVDTLSCPAYRGLSINSLKIYPVDFLMCCPWHLEATPFHEQTFYISRDEQKLGKHPYHIGGWFYLQEPSASSVASLLDVRQGDWVLDLCAAPGGKSSQLAKQLQHTGFLVSNEIDRKRAQVLMSNLERMGVGENMVTSAHPEALCKALAGHFDRVLVDAPCSGEGMFKINEQAMQDWSLKHVQACKERQLHILESAYQALKMDGILVYSTCTYAIEENEAVIDAFLKNHEDMELIPIDVNFGRAGKDYGLVDGRKVRRIFPMDKGEGHFMAKLKKKGMAPQAKLTYLQPVHNALVKQFIKDQIGDDDRQVFMLQDKVFMMKQAPLYLSNITVLRQGIQVGTIIKNRLEPHHHFYMDAAHQMRFIKVYDMCDEECRKYLHGDVLEAKLKGYYACRWNGCILGFAKGDGVYLKNKFPKGLRLT